MGGGQRLMCTDCGHIHGHTGQCPNNPAEYEPEMVVCPICEQEVPDEDMRCGVCETCLGKAATYKNALDYGADRKTSVELNGYLAYELDADEIEEALKQYLEFAREIGALSPRSFFLDDSSDFADWLKERKKH